MEILVSDTNIFIDLYKCDLLDLLFKLPAHIHTVDVVVEELKNQEQKAAVIHYQGTQDLYVKSWDDKEVQCVFEYMHKDAENTNLTFEDCSVLCYTKQLSDARLLTGDQKLRCHAVLQIGNLKSLLDDLELIDSQVEKVNVSMRLKNLEPVKYLKDGVAVFDMIGINQPKILKDIRSDHMQAESRYSVKTDYLELYRMGKYANFLIDSKKDDLLKYNLDHLKEDFDKEISVHMVKLLENGKYLIRAITSEKRYKDYGINFSILVALLVLSNYMKQSHQPVSISHYHVDESKVFVSFAIAKKQPISDSLDVSFNLNLENDEIKESSVMFDASFRLTFRDHGQTTYLDIMPTSYKGINKPYSTNMLTCSHSLTVKKVYERVSNLTKYIDEYVNQVVGLAPNIVKISNPKKFKSFIINKIHNAHHVDFLSYKESVINKLISIDVNTVFDLF